MSGSDGVDTAAAAVARGRAAYARRAWREAYAALLAADSVAELEPEDLQLLATSAALTGRDAEFLDLLERLYQLHLSAGRSLRAARCGVWLVLRAFSLGQAARAGGWLSRVRRLIETEAGGCAEEGYLLVPTVHRLLASGDGLGASETAARAVEIGERFGDVDLAALGRNLQGWALLRQERLDAGLELIDESMLAATSGELSPIVTGLVYCTSISSCHEVYALGRVREWTAVLGSWCDAQPELVTFSGVCLAHRAEVLQLHGDWSGALEQARRVAERFAPGRDPEGSANAAYQTAEIQRLRGELELAEATYQRVAVLGREPQPGLALLRLRQGKREQAASGLRTALAGSSSPLQRARFLPALVEVLLELGDTPSAAAACAELEATALRYATEALTAFASATRARVELAQGEARSALARLRPAFGIWQRSSAPYLAARTRLLLAEACAALGDEEGARFELMAARAIFQELGAAPDVAHVDALCVPSEACAASNARPSGLTPRELEVLRVLAAGKTNRAIARELGLSEKTIDRHVSNIFTKIAVSSRAAATAYAYQHGLL